MTKLAALSKDSKGPAKADPYEALKDKMGRYRTKSLFWEHRNPKYPAPFTLKDKDHKGSVSLYRKYMEIGDPTEYQFAQVCFGSWKHWEVIKAGKWFQEYLLRWREELHKKMESDRFWEMKEQIDKSPGSPQAVSASRWLADRYTPAPKDKPKRGRPSKVERQQALDKETEEAKMLAEEAERLGL